MTYALFADAFAAYRAAEALRSLGVPDAELSLVTRQQVQAADDGSVRTDGRAPTTRPLNEPQGTMSHGGDNSTKAAAGLAAGAVFSSIFFPGLGIVLGGGALAAALGGAMMKKSAQGHGPTPLEDALREGRLSDDAVTTISQQLDSDGALLQLHHRAPGGIPSEAQILQTVSDHGGRIVWGADEFSAPETERTTLAPGA